MSIEVEIREIDPQPFMAVHFKSSREDLGKHFGEALPAAFGHVVSQGKQPAGMPIGQYLSGTPDEFEVDLETENSHLSSIQTPLSKLSSNARTGNTMKDVTMSP